MRRKSDGFKLRKWPHFVNKDQAELGDPYTDERRTDGRCEEDKCDQWGTSKLLYKWSEERSMFLLRISDLLPMSFDREHDWEK